MKIKSANFAKKKKQKQTMPSVPYNLTRIGQTKLLQSVLQHTRNKFEHLFIRLGKKDTDKECSCN